MNHQELMDLAFEKYGVDDNYNQFISKLPKNEQCAVILGTLNYQIENGGWIQWCDNGYCTEYKKLVSILTEMNTDISKEILSMLKEVGYSLKHKRPNRNDLDKKFYKINSKFLEECETFLANIK